jgi:hypothetical protein
VVEAPANVGFAVPKSSFGETLPSKDGPHGTGARRSVGVPTPLVVGLVLAALVAGFLLGWAFGRM